MDYEKKYKETLEKARQLCAYPTTKPFISDLQDLFPELKESEDEKIRKALLEHIVRIDSEVPLGAYHRINNVDNSEIIAWLENIPYTIDHEKREGFYLGYKAGLEKQGESYTKKDVDDAFVEGMALAKNELEKQGEQKVGYTTLVETGNGGINALVTRELPTDGCDDEQKSAWSEDDDDDAWMNDIISKVENNLQLNKAEIDWLKSIRPQPKQEWGKWDESYLSTTIAYLKDAKDFKKTAENCIDWLKNLKQRIKRE